MLDSGGFWLKLTLRLVFGSGLCALVWLGFGPVWALGIACFWLFTALVSHWWLLHRMRLWLRAPDTERIPDAGGAWGAVLANLYRAQRDNERNRARLEAGLDRFREAAGALPDGAMLLDSENRIEWFNRVAASQFGLDPERDVGTLVTHLIRQPEFSRYVSAEDYREAVLLRSSLGGGRVYSVQLVPVAVGGRLLLSRDVTSVEKVETMRRDFIANVSHELRTPLTVILGLLEHLTESGVDAKTRRQFLAMLRDQAARMDRLVEDLLTLSRLETGSPAVREEVVDVPGLVSVIADEARAMSGGRHAISSVVVPDRLNGNREELRSAFSNLVTNAIRYTPEGGRIELRWTIEGNKPLFSVQDSGIGIASDHIPRLTERFYRVDKGRSTETGGTGLGLAIVKHVLLRHQANLRIESVPGQGSTFSAVFPAVRLVPRDAARAAAASMS